MSSRSGIARPSQTRIAASVGRSSRRSSRASAVSASAKYDFRIALSRCIRCHLLFANCQFTVFQQQVKPGQIVAGFPNGKRRCRLFREIQGSFICGQRAVPITAFFTLVRRHRAQKIFGKFASLGCLKHSLPSEIQDGSPFFAPPRQNRSSGRPFDETRLAPSTWNRLSQTSILEREQVKGCNGKLAGWRIRARNSFSLPFSSSSNISIAGPRRCCHSGANSAGGRCSSSLHPWRCDTPSREV